MFKKSLAIASVLVSFNTVPAQHKGNVVKAIDNEIRLAYYLSCKEQKQKQCHTKAFENSVRLRWEES